MGFMLYSKQKTPLYKKKINEKKMSNESP